MAKHPEYMPLKTPIPLEYAKHLGVSISHVSHVNAGRRRLTILQSIMMMEFALTDDRLKHLTILDLRPELRPALPYLCRLCPRDRKISDKRKAKRG